MNEKVYKDGTTLDQIILDGWSRDFCASQTCAEASAQGFQVSSIHVIEEWIKFDDQMERDFSLMNVEVKE